MRKSALGVLAVGVAAATLLTSCSSSGGSSTSKTSGSAPAGGSSSSSSGTAASGKVQVGVILPDTTSSTRYTLYDQPLLKKAFDAAGIKSDIQNAGGSVPKQAQLAQQMIGEGIKVLLIDSIDATSGAAVEQKAKAAGVQVIDYDRVNLGGSAGYYVSFDNELVGKLQAQTLISCLNAKKVSDPKIIEMDGGKDVDNNAVLFAKGADEVFAANSSKLKVVSKNTVPGWDKNKAAGIFQQALTENGGKVDGVLAANDDIASEVITVLTNKGLTVPVTGQDAGVVGLQNILTGKQCMTVFKDVKKEAAAAALLAIALIKGTKPTGTALVKFDDPKEPSHNIQALLLQPLVITKANVQDVITAGALTAAEICKGIQSSCTKAGVK